MARTMTAEAAMALQATRDPAPPIPVRALRAAVDALDDVLVTSLAARRALARGIAALKREAGAPVRDGRREAAILARGQRLGQFLGLPGSSARRLLELAIADAREAQSGGTAVPSPAARVLAWLPPPARLVPLLQPLPPAPLAPLVARILEAALAEPAARGWLAELEGRAVCIHVRDLGLRWTVRACGTRLRVGPEQPEATVSASGADLLLLAARLEDADTLFFERRLTLTGDTELGLTVRNLLDRVDWARVPLALRILLNRMARLADAARAARREAQARRMPGPPDQ